MTQKTSSFLDAKYGWDYGESGWNTGMDENLLKFSFLFDKNIEGIVSSLPSTVTNGTAYFLSTDKRIYFGVGGVWYSTPTPKWFILTLRTSGVTYQFNGTDLVSVPSNSDLASQLSAVQVTISALGTAAFKNIEYFTTPAQLAAAVASSQSYTDSQVATKAAKGANSDITSLSGLTTPLTVAQGGTGGSTTIAARNALGLGNVATRDSRALPNEISPSGVPATYDDGFAFGYSSPGATINGNGNGFNYYQFKIVSDQAVQQIGVNGATGPKVNGLNVSLNFGGPNTRGGRHGILGQCLQGFGGAGATDSNNGDRNYCGVQGLCFTDSGDGGTGPTDVRGAYFGGSSFGAVLGGSYVANLTGHEFNTQINAGSGPTAGVRVAIHTGIQVASLIGERGYGLDACFSGSNLGGSTYGWKYGLAFHGANGRAAFDADSTVLKVFTTASATATIDKVIDVTGVTSNSIISSSNVNLADTGFTLNRANVAVTLGASATSNTPSIQLRSSGAAAAFDARLIAIGGSSTLATGLLQLDAGNVVLGGTLTRPSADAAQSHGSAAFRHTQYFAVTGTIGTSDAREKTEVKPFNIDELNAAKTLAKEIGTFKWLASIQAKGEDSRTHVGLTVQRAIEVMEENNLDPMAYGFICYDEWEATDAVTSENEEGEVEVIQPATEAGSRYGFRMDQLNLFIAAGFEARLSALEAL